MSELLHQNTTALARTGGPAPACTLVVFGADGDLTRRLLMPSLYNLAGSGLLGEGFGVLGVDRNPLGDDDYRARQTGSIRDFVRERAGEPAAQPLNEPAWDWVRQRLHYLPGDFMEPPTYAEIERRIGNGNAIFYLAVADRFFSPIIDQLSHAGLVQQGEGRFRRVVIEKPFGHDLASAHALNDHILGELEENQIYRIDHFLGKETVQNIMALRFANGFFEPLWNRDHIESVQITASETVGVEKRGKFYEATGAMRDMVPNHIFQLLAMTAMEPPNSFDADAVRNEKSKVIDAIHLMSADEVRRNVVRGQYTAGTINTTPVPGYREEPDVSPASATETYVAMKLAIDNWRWIGVPFYLRTGKRMERRKTEVAITFKRAPVAMFRSNAMPHLASNTMVLHLQPHEGISFHFSAKKPGQVVELAPVRMDFKYDDYFQLKPSTGYETLIYDVMIGDATLFNRADNIEAGWRVVQPILDVWADGRSALEPYPAGSEGPAAADDLLARDGYTWRKPG